MTTPKQPMLSYAEIHDAIWGLLPGLSPDSKEAKVLLRLEAQARLANALAEWVKAQPHGEECTGGYSADSPCWCGLRDILKELP